MNEKSQPEKTKQDTLHFYTSSGIKSIVGKDLITDRYIAIFELVKNSYDARATEVFVSFNTSEASENNIGDIENGKIYIVDNGRGMTKNDLENKWLGLAFSDKREGNVANVKDENDSLRDIKNRVYVGSKGIGRFSSDSLGAVIKIYTKVFDEDIEHQLTVNWDEFDISLANRFEDVGVKYESTTSLSRNDTDSYTIIEISDLRQGWSDKELQAAEEKLRRLKNPFIANDDLTIYFGVDIFKINQEKNDAEKFKIKSNISEVLREKSINIIGEITPESINVVLRDRGKKIYEVTKKNDSILRNINKIKININFLTTSAKNVFTRRMGVEPVNYGNVFIYRNGFHVSPYGETEYDIFGINKRKSQGYNRYIGTREIIGFISIDDDKNLFKETSSRNHGFIQNGYFNSLENIYIEYIHKPLEHYVRLIKWGEDKDTGNEISIDSIELSSNATENFKRYVVRDSFKVVKFDDSLDFEKNKPEKIIDRLADTSKSDTSKKEVATDKRKLKTQFKELKKENIDTKKTIAKTKEKVTQLERQNRFLTESRSESSYAQQITHHFTILAERLDFAIDDFFALKSSIDKDKSDDFYAAIELVQSTKLEIELFRKLLLKTSYDIRASERINWYELTDWYFKKNGRGTYYKNFNVNCIADGNMSNWDICSSHIETLMMFENFYKNAFEHNASYIDFHFSDDKILISSNSSPIDPDNINNIFDLGFSTKANGTGIGLYQIKANLKELNYTVSVNSDELVTFAIQRET